MQTNSMTITGFLQLSSFLTVATNNEQTQTWAITAALDVRQIVHRVRRPTEATDATSAATEGRVASFHAQQKEIISPTTTTKEIEDHESPLTVSRYIAFDCIELNFVCLQR